MLFSLLCTVLRAVLRLAPAGEEHDREVEVLVLRHQVKVLGGRVGRPKLRRRTGCSLPRRHACCPASAGRAS